METVSTQKQASQSKKKKRLPRVTTNAAKPGPKQQGKGNSIHGSRAHVEKFVIDA
jgi:hypothetical protein